MKFLLLLLGLCPFCSLNASAPEEEMPPQHLFKILSLGEWKESQGQPYVRLSSYDIHFIHLCTEAQIERIINKFYGNEEQVIIIKLATPKLPGKLVKEKNPGGLMKYYHLYDGSIPMNCIIDYQFQTVPK
jgi:uncharacterized protein (DUF952 family)